MSLRPVSFSLPVRWLRCVRRLKEDRRGNIMMIFGLALLPITFATAMGIDYGQAMRKQTQLNAIADAAALAAVTDPMMKQNMFEACTAARNMFRVQSEVMNGVQLRPSQLSDVRIEVTDTFPNSDPVKMTCPNTDTDFAVPDVLPLSRTATISYSGESANSFAGILGLDTLHIGGMSSAKTTLAPYIDIHVALDTSQSMGLAATDADAAALWERTTQYNGEGCTFGCHVAGPGKPYANEVLASNASFGAPIKLRVNVLRDATQDMIQTAIDNQQGNASYRFGLYRIGTTLTPIQELSAQLATVKSAAGSVTLGPNDSSGVGDTNLGDMTDKMFDNIKWHGDGTQQSKARAFLFIITDGVTDIKGDCTYGHCTRPIDPATCQRYKDAGITVGIVYTTYIPVKSDPLNPNSTSLRAEYTDLVQKFSWSGYISPNPSDNSRDIAPALAACASTGWYFEASDGPAIHTAMQRLFQQASQTPTIIR